MRKNVKGYEGLYKVNSDGELLSISYRGSGKSKLLNKVVVYKKGKSHGYLNVRLTKDGLTKGHLIHRLVAQAFIPNPENKPQINHKNGVRNDNRVENLERCTNSENGIHSFRVLGRVSLGPPPRYGKDNHQTKVVHQYTIGGNLVATFESIRDAAKEMGVSNVAIGNCANGKVRTSCGYVRKF